MQSYMQQIERAIAGAFVNDKLSIHLLGGIQGPHTLTFGVKLYQPTKANVAKALALGPAIEACTGVSPVRVYTEQGAVLVEVPSPSPVIIDGTKYAGAGLAVPLGMTGRRAIVGVDFDKDPHLVLVGPTKRGKTVAQRCIAYHLARQNRPSAVRFIFTTFKSWDWEAFGKVAHTMDVITDPNETETMINWLLSTMYERLKTKTELPHLFLFLDDLLNLLARIDVSDQLGELASLGRGVGIHLVIGTQRLNERGAGSSIISGNMPTKLVFGTASAQDAAAFSGRGESGAEKLGRYKGDALLIDDGSVTRLAVALITDQDLAKLPQNSTPVRPWQQKLQRYTLTGTTDERTSRVPKNRTSPSTLENEQNSGWNVPADQGGESGAEIENTPFDPRYVPQPTRLPDAPPTADEQKYLRQLYVSLGSKRAVLKAAWGGVVNDEGRTPKTIKWLNQALGEDLDQ